jgi:predicted kinase
MLRPLLVVAFGRPAAGKSTLAQWIADRLPAWRVAEVAIKRALRPTLGPADVFDEDLRNVSYRAAISAAEALVGSGRSCVIDATFHRRERRVWITSMAASMQTTTIWLYCRCDDEREVGRRLAGRALDGPDGHARSFEAFRYMNASFEEPLDDEWSPSDRVVLLAVDTAAKCGAAPRFPGTADTALMDEAKRVERVVSDYFHPEPGGPI